MENHTSRAASWAQILVDRGTVIPAVYDNSAAENISMNGTDAEIQLCQVCTLSICTFLTDQSVNDD